MPLLAIVGCAADEPLVDPDSCDAAEAFRIDRIDLPLTSAAARAVAFDLDRNDTKDNQLGQVIGALDGYFDEPFDLSAAATGRVTTDVVWTVAIRRCPAPHVLVSIGGEGGSVELVGTAIAGTISARGTGGELPVSAVFDPLQSFTEPGWLADPGTGTRLEARLGVAPLVEPTIVAVARPMLGFLQQRAANNPGLRELFDTDKDGSIDLREVQTNSLTVSLLAADLEDGAISFGLAISATRVP